MRNLDLRNLSELKAFLRSHDLRLRKSFSQNFIIEKSILKRLVESANVTANETILEIGPGLGSITRTLLEIDANVCAVELDRYFCNLLPSILKPWEDRLNLIEGDILKQEFHTPMKVVSNIPFQITSPIVAYLAKHRSIFKDIVLIIQDDMAHRMQSVCGSKENNSFAIFCHFYFSIKPLFKIPNTCFFPQPKVKCAAIQMKPHEHLPLPDKDHDAFFKFVRGCFAHKRKMLRSTQKHLGILAALDHLGLKETTRAEDLSLEKFLSIFVFLSSTSNHPES